MASFTAPMNPGPLPEVDNDDELPGESAAVASAEVYAHQSAYGEDTLNVEIDAPSGVTVRVHLNDGRLAEVVVP